MRKIVTVWACALTLCVGGLAIADSSSANDASAPAAPVQDNETGVYSKSAIYVGLDGLGAVDDNFDDGDGGLGLRVGWRFHPNVAVEATYQYYHDLDVGDGWSVSGNVKPYLLTGRWQPYLLAGLGYLDNNPSGDFIIRVGAGMDACITEHWTFGPEITYAIEPESSNDGFLTFGFGITYKATAS